MGSLGTGELVVIVLVAIVVFGPRRLPELARKAAELIKQAREHSCGTVTGVEMFVRQAAAQFERFTDLEPPLDLIRETLRKKISPVQY